MAYWGVADKTPLEVTYIELAKPASSKLSAMDQTDGPLMYATKVSELLTLEIVLGFWSG
jgi:hypothetical protein